MKEYRRKVKAIILSITGVLVALVLIRFFLVLFGANTGQPIINVIMSLSNPLVAPFAEFNRFVANPSFDVASLTALMVIIVVGLLITDIVTAFMYDNFNDVMLNVVDAIFKVIESLLIIRLVMKLLGVEENAGAFVASIYNITNWASGVFAPIKVFTGVLEISTLAVLIIVAVIDFSTENVVTSLRNREKRSEIAAKQAAPVAVMAPKPAAPVQQHITINVPSPQPTPQVINVQQPPAA